MADLFTARLAAHGSPHTAIITIHEKRRGTTVHNDTIPPPRENNFISSLSLRALLRSAILPRNARYPKQIECACALHQAVADMRSACAKH